MPRKTTSWTSARASSRGFNEAAARCRGKLGQGKPGGEHVPGFNEAAARCRGKRGLHFVVHPRDQGLQ